MARILWEVASHRNAATATLGNFFPASEARFTSLYIEGVFSEVGFMALREQFTEQLKAAMRAGDAPRVSTLRMITARLKDTDIAARPKGIAAVPDDEILAMLRTMVKSRRESVDLYRQGNRPELAAKEEAEIALIETFLPARMDDAALDEAVAAAIAAAGAVSVKEMGKVMAALKATHGAALDMGRAGAIVRAKLGG
jgi:uncharacterized protein YqeY